MVRESLGTFVVGRLLLLLLLLPHDAACFLCLAWWQHCSAKATLTIILTKVHGMPRSPTRVNSHCGF